MSIKYNKLVRDKIPEIIMKQGKDVTITTASDEELYKYRKAKVLEELEEFKEVVGNMPQDYLVDSCMTSLGHADKNLRDACYEELADVLESFYFMMRGSMMTEKELKELFEVIKDKREKRGSFYYNYILKEVEDCE